MAPHGRMLEGYTVLDLTQFLSGPMCSSTLGAFGAEVIKVEPPAGDGNRQLPPFLSHGNGGEPRHNRSLVFFKRNQGKKSIVLDLKSEDGERILKKLIAEADVLMHNFREGVAERIGVGFDQAREVNENIIYCSITGQLGRIGDTASEDLGQPAGVIDIVGQALSGLLGSTGPSGGDPTRSRAPIADQTAGLYATISVLAAVVERDVRNGGSGARRIRVPMIESLAGLLWDESLDAFRDQGFENRMGNLSGRLCPYNTYKTRDGKFVTIAAASSGEWNRLKQALEVRALDRAEWAEASSRAESRKEIDELIGSWASARDRDEAIQVLKAHGVTAGAVLEIEDMLTSDAYRESVLYELKDDNFGTLHAPRFPIEIDGERIPGPTGPVPQLGEHGREILRGKAGLSESEIDELSRLGAFIEPHGPDSHRGM